MTFGSAAWLWALLLVPILFAVFVRNEKRSIALVRRIVAARLVSQLAGNVSHSMRRLRHALLLLAFACLVVALSKPRWGYTFEEARRKGRDVIIAIDTSRSMLANDLPPNRLTRAKMAARDLIGQLQGDRVGLVAFAGSAFLQAPLTIDYGAVLNALQELDPKIIPRGGTNIAQAIETAIDAFGKGESESRAIVLFTDGEELDENAVKLAKKYADQITIFTVGVGSEEGAIIPVPKEGGGTDFVRDAGGEVVRSQLDAERLQEIADPTGGFYQRLSNGPADMRRIVTSGLGKMTEQQIDARMARRPIERYQWPLSLGMVLLATTILISDRRRRDPRRIPGPLGQTVVVAATLVLSSYCAHAANKGVTLYHEQNFEESYRHFHSQLERQPDSQALHYDAGTAAYKLGKYEEALQAFSEALTTKDPSLRQDAEYNLGNTLYQRGVKQQDRDVKIKEWKSAIEHYDEALAINAKNENAQYNRDLVQKLIDELEKQQQQQKKQNEEQNQEQSNEQKQEQEQQKGNEGKDQEKEKEQQDGGSGEKQEDNQTGNGKNEDEKKGGSDDKQDQKGTGQDGDDESEKSEADKRKESDQRQSKRGDDERESQNPQPPRESDSQKGSSRESDEPAPVPSPSDRDLSGEMRAQQDESQEAGQPREAQQAVADEDGKMNAQQAAALLRSLQDEDAQVPLLQRRQSAPVLKDW